MNQSALILEIVRDNLDPLHFNDEHLTIAELSSAELNGRIRTLDMNTALVTSGLIRKIKPSHTCPHVKTASASYHHDWGYRPDFWLYLSPAAGLKRAEPLAVSWASGQLTTLLPDQRLLKTFNLIPAPAGEEILWHDLSKPLYNVVINKGVSTYDFPRQTAAYVRIHTAYLKEYLLLRKKAAVQIFTLTTELQASETIKKLLNGKNHYTGEACQYEIRLRKSMTDEDTVHLEINGYRLLFEPVTLTGGSGLSLPGHYWKGIDGLVDDWRARHEMPGTFIYVSDDVLAKFENDDDYEVCPESGSVSFRNQWSISHCERVGRNGIRIELKKLYEGTPDEMIAYWNRFSIEASEIQPGEHIEEKSRRLIRKFFLFGRLMAGLINRACNFGYHAQDVISLNEQDIDYRGWTMFPDYLQISCHVPLCGFSRDQFMQRCRRLYQLLGENIREAKIRKVIECLGIPEQQTKGLRGLKLLELLLKYLAVARDSGLDVSTAKEEIVERALELKDYSPLADLIILAEIRNMASHKGGDIKTKLQAPLKSLGIEPNAQSGGYANACDQLYDRLADLLTTLNLWLGEL
jgi:hypothetical protein